MPGGLPGGSSRSVLINPKIRDRRREAPLASTHAGQPVNPSHAILVRVVEYKTENRATRGELFCLITNLLDHETAPPGRARRRVPRTLRHRAVVRRDRNTSRTACQRSEVIGTASSSRPGMGEPNRLCDYQRSWLIGGVAEHRVASLRAYGFQTHYFTETCVPETGCAIRGECADGIGNTITSPTLALLTMHWHDHR